MKTVSPSFVRPSSGRSLIELMVAIVIGSLVLVAIMVITGNSTSIGRRSDSLGGLTDTGQIALQLLASEVRMAGYSVPRTYFVAGYVTKMMPDAGIRGCDNGFTNPSEPVFGDLACQAGANQFGDAISVAYEADDFNAVLAAGGGAPSPSDCRGVALDRSVAGVGNEARPAVSADTMSETPAYWRMENRYFVAPSGTDGEPSLMCTGNGGAPFDSTITLIRGVQRMEVSYGVAQGQVDASRSDNVMVINDPSVVNYMTAAQIDGNPAWLGEPSTVRWQRVVSARVCLETLGAVGSAEAGSSFIACNGVRTAINDGRARRAVRMTMNLRNRTLPVNETTGIGLGGV